MDEGHARYQVKPQHKLSISANFLPLSSNVKPPALFGYQDTSNQNAGKLEQVVDDLINRRPSFSSSLLAFSSFALVLLRR